MKQMDMDVVDVQARLGEHPGGIVTKWMRFPCLTMTVDTILLQTATSPMLSRRVSLPQCIRVIGKVGSPQTANMNGVWNRGQGH